MKDQKKPSHENWKWLPAIVVGGTLVSTLLIAALVTFYISPDNSEKLSLFASFFSNIATPFVTVAAVGMAYLQLKHQQKNQHDEVKRIFTENTISRYEQEISAYINTASTYLSKAESVNDDIAAITSSSNSLQSVERITKWAELSFVQQQSFILCAQFLTSHLESTLKYLLIQKGTLEAISS